MAEVKIETKNKANALQAVLAIACIIFVAIAVGLYMQSGTLKATIERQKADIDSFTAVQSQSEQQLDEAKAKLADQAETIASLQKQLDEANAAMQALTAEKEQLLSEQESLQQPQGILQQEAQPEAQPTPEVQPAQ